MELQSGGNARWQQTYQYDFYGLFKNKLPNNSLPTFGGPDPFKNIWKTAMVIVRVQQGLSISNRAFGRIDRVVSAR